MTPIIIAVVSALLGGGLAKLLDWWLNKNKSALDENRQWRAEDRQRIDDLQLDMKELKEELVASSRREAEWKLHCEQIFWDFKQFQLEMYQVLLANSINPVEHIKPYEFPVFKG